MHRVARESIPRALVAAVALAIAALVAATPVHADEPLRAGTSYAWQAVGLDLSAAGIMGASLAYRSVPLFALGATTYLVGGPIVHAAHGDGRWQRSLLWRLGLPLAGLGTGALLGLGLDCDNPNDDLCPTLNKVIPAALGGVVGGLVAVVVDGTVVRFEVTPVMVPVTGGGVALGVHATW